MAEAHRVTSVTENGITEIKTFDNYESAKKHFDIISTMAHINFCQVVSKIGRSWVFRVCYVKRFRN